MQTVIPIALLSTLNEDFPLLDIRRLGTFKSENGFTVLRIVAGLVLIFTLSGLGLLSALHLPFFQKKGITLIAERVYKRSGYSFHMSSYGGWPFSRFHLTDIQVQASGKEVLQCPHALIRYRISARPPYLELLEVELQKPTLYLEKDPVEGWRIPRPEKRTEGAPRESASADRSRCKEFPLPKLRVESGTILGEQNGQRVMTLRDVTGTLGMKVDCSTGIPRIKMDLHEWQGGAGTGG